MTRLTTPTILHTPIPTPFGKVRTPDFSTGIPPYEYFTPPSFMNKTDETPHHKYNNYIAGACPTPYKLTPPLLHPIMNLPENSSPLAAQSLYPGQQLMTPGTDETRQIGDNRDHSHNSNPAKTAESLLWCCQSASRRGNTGLVDRPNLRYISTHKLQL